MKVIEQKRLTKYLTASLEYTEGINAFFLHEKLNVDPQSLIKPTLETILFIS